MSNRTKATKKVVATREGDEGERLLMDKRLLLVKATTHWERQERSAQEWADALARRLCILHYRRAAASALLAAPGTKATFAELAQSELSGLASEEMELREHLDEARRQCDFARAQQKRIREEATPAERQRL